MLAHHYLSALGLVGAANQDIVALVPRARTALHAAADRACAANAFTTAARYYRPRSCYGTGTRKSSGQGCSGCWARRC
jgi:hypothetical protein